jgi:hypothetical protein
MVSRTPTSAAGSVLAIETRERISSSLFKVLAPSVRYYLR